MSKLNTSSKVLFSVFEQIMQQYSDAIIRNYDLIMNVPESHKDPTYTYKTSDLLDMACCIAVEVENEGL